MQSKTSGGTRCLSERANLAERGPVASVGDLVNTKSTKNTSKNAKR